MFLVSHRGISSASILITFILVFVFCTVCIAICSLIRLAVLRRTFLLLVTLNYVALGFLMAYWAVTGHPLDLYFLLDSPSEVIPTGIQVLGAPSFLLLLCAFWLFGMSVYVLLSKCAWTIQMRWLVPLRVRTVVIFLGIIIVSSTAVPRLHAAFLQDVGKVTFARNADGTIISDNSVFRTDSAENIFILQVESLNGIALNGDAIVKGEQYVGNFMPRLTSIARDGIFFPHFWGNAVQTNRAQATILCGIVNNLKNAFSFRLNEISEVCLPEQLKASGYTTAFYRSDRLSFANTGPFMEKLGFEEIHHDDIMREGDRRYSWGYDDCIFYQRAFEDLSRNHQDKSKLFAYFEVSSNHMDFDPKEEYEHISIFSEPSNYIENYINSSLAQDHCVGRFYELYKRYAPDDTHLFILGDHSWPIGIHGNTYNEREGYTDNFVTSVLYVPPRNRRKEFAIGKTVSELTHSQTDIIPTIYSLLNSAQYQNSFAFELYQQSSLPASLLARQGRAHYEQCHILTQPYGGGRVAIVHGPNKYTYHIDSQKLQYSNVSRDPLEFHQKTIAQKLSYEAFLNQFMCKRYRL